MLLIFMSKPIEKPFLNVTTKLLVTNTSKKIDKRASVNTARGKNNSYCLKTPKPDITPKSFD